MRRYDCVLFDLDGTLTDPFDGITRSVQKGLLHFGIEEPDREKLRAFIGPPLRESFVKYYDIPKQRAEEAIAAYREYFSVTGLFENELYEGTTELLRGLCENGVKVILATSKPEVFARRITAHFGIDKYFYDQCGADLEGKCETKAQVVARALEISRTSPERVIMVGDRMHDVIGAKANGVGCAGVLWGYGTRSELEEAGADIVFEKMDELRLWLC